ncbi:MAG: VPLPA-CTERM sorting domain-containing protein [Pseudomonadota bacterium]
MKKSITLAATAAALFASANAAPVLDGGWFGDQIDDVGINSASSPYVFTLTNDAFFRITDAFIPGDDLVVNNNGSLLFDPGFAAFPMGFGDNIDADTPWTDMDFESGEILLTAGMYSITVQGDGAAGLPAGFFVRLDSASEIPVPAAAPLMLAGLGAIAARRRKKTA